MASSRCPFWPFGASASSSPANFLLLSRTNIERICELIRHAEPLNPRQCLSMSSKLKKTVENIESLASWSEDVNPFYGCVALENFYRVSEKAKKLVENCCSVDWCHWCPASAFQIQNEEAFREILLETSLSYSTIYEILEDINKGNSPLDLRSSSTFDPPRAEEIFEDRVALRDRLEGLVNAANISSSDFRFLRLGKYLLGRVKFALNQSIDEDFDVRSSNLSLDGKILDGEWSEKSERLGASVIKTAWFDVPCAKKVFEDTLREDEWLAEASILASLNHPNIVKFLCCNKHETVHTSGHFIAMEQMETSLLSFIRRRKERGAKLSLFLALDIILQVGYGMYYLHDNGIAHRDLKTPNVVCSYNQPFLEVKIVDFGLAKIKLNQDKSNSISRPKRGTTTYMAPEAFSNGRANWFKADVYSFSVMCSVILSGEEPFQNIKRSDVYAAICSGQRPKLPVTTPKELASLIKEGWAQDRDLRPNFWDICARLEKLRHRLLWKHSLPSLGLRLKVEDQYDEEHPGDLYIKSTMKKRSEIRQLDRSSQISMNLTTEEEFFDGDEVEEQQQSVQPQHQLQEGIAIAEDGRGGIYGSSSCGGLQVSRWGSSSGVGGGGVDSPQSVGSAFHLSSTSPLWSSLTDRGTVEWLSASPPLITSQPLSVEPIQAQAGVPSLAIPGQPSADVPFNSGLPRVAAKSLQAKGKHSSLLQHHSTPLQVAPSSEQFVSNPAATATHPSPSVANQCCPRPLLVSRNGLAMNYLDGDYWREASSSIKLVQEMLSGHRVQLHLRQCQYLVSRMSDTGSFLTGKSNSLVGITSSDDIRRKALRQLHFTVMRAETLVRGCCCEVVPSWLESAVTLAQIKEDIVHILLDFRWWTSMVDITMASVTWVTRGREIEQELLEMAEKDIQKLLEELHSPDNELDKAFVEDKQQLLRRVWKVLSSYSGKPRDLDYLLATHVRTRLENTDLVQSMANADLNECKLTSFIGMGSFGAVMDVQWLGRSCALKVLNYKCAKEATSLSSFHHPHIVQFFRYWEAPVSSKSGESTPYSTPSGNSTAIGSSTSPRVASVPPELSLSAQSHILMELLPTDLQKHMSNPATNVMPQDVAIDVMLQVTKAMWHLNNYNVAHRDLKPSNVLVEPVNPLDVPELAARGYMRVKLGDFGLVNTKAMSMVNTTATKNVGTKIYGAPEVFIKDSPFPKKSPKFPRLADVWSFGIMFHEVLSGQPPFLVEQRKHGTRALHTRIQKGLRPQLPANCPDYLNFCITNCLQLQPQDRPSFADLWKLLRFAQVRNLGIIREDHDLFAFTTRQGVVKRLHKPKQSALDKDPKPSSFGLLFRRITSLSTRRRDPSTEAIQNSNRKQSRAGSSKTQSEGKPLGYLVNPVGTQDATPDNTKLDVIFFEGNVGRRKYLSCMDTWVQRGKPDVWWPRDWLSKDFIGDIRVLLLEYSISENGVEGVVEELQKLLVFSDRWNRGHTWNRPIVLVGHSLGCVVIEQLVVALNKTAESFGSLKGDFEAKRANVSKAFLASLAGCFFYAPPYTGLVPSEDLLKYVFGGLTYSPTLFNDLCLTSPKLKELSERFMEARSDGVKLVALIEGFHTRGRTVVPAVSMDDFKASGGRVEELNDSNHSDTCKPVDKKHPAYRFLFEFIQELLKERKAIGRDPSTEAIHNVNQKQSRAAAGSSKTQSEGKPLGYLMNPVGTQDATSGSAKLDVIFFEGNVGRRKYLSCADTWVQCGKPDLR